MEKAEPFDKKVSNEGLLSEYSNLVVAKNWEMKLPYFPFYPGDWLKDTRCLSPAAKGAWIDIMVAMWDAQNRGVLSYSHVGYARIIGASAEQAKALIDELTEFNICDREDLPNGKVKLISRRMVTEEKKRHQVRTRVVRHRNAKCNADVTHLVTPPAEYEDEIEVTVSSSSLPESLRTDSFAEAWTKWLNHLDGMRQRPSIHSQEAQLLECSKWGEQRSIAAIEHSIRKSYKGIYESKDEKPKPKPESNQREEKMRVRNLVTGQMEDV